MKVLPTQFEGHDNRRVYDEATETWWFSVVDVVQALTDSSNARRYWSDVKRKLAQEAGSEQPYEKIVQLKLPAPDGKQRLTDCASAATLLRMVQSIPSPKAEPIKLWLAKVGFERMQEMADPALSLDRARETWQQHGRSDKWIQQRMTGQETRNKLTDYWRDHGIQEGQEFAILTSIIHQEWSGVSVKAHKQIKGLKSHNLRDHMSEAELIFTAPACNWKRKQAAAWCRATTTWRRPQRRPQSCRARPEPAAMNEAETRAEHIDPALKAAGWGVVEGSRVMREHGITLGRLQGSGGNGARAKAEIADYVLVSRNTKLAVIEAKAWDKPLTQGVGQAKSYAAKLAVRFTDATNGHAIYGIDMGTGAECEVASYPSPDEL